MAAETKERIHLVYLMLREAAMSAVILWILLSRNHPWWALTYALLEGLGVGLRRIKIAEGNKSLLGEREASP